MPPVFGPISPDLARMPHLVFLDDGLGCISAEKQRESYGQWREEQRAQAWRMEQQLASRRALDELIDAQLARFRAHYNGDMRLSLPRDVPAILQPPWKPPLENAALSWLGDWRPSAILCLIPTMSSFSSSPFLELSPRAQRMLAGAIRGLRVREAVLDEEMAAYQANAMLNLLFSRVSSKKKARGVMEAVAEEMRTMDGCRWNRVSPSQPAGQPEPDSSLSLARTYCPNPTRDEQLLAQARSKSGRAGSGFRAGQVFASPNGLRENHSRQAQYHHERPSGSRTPAVGLPGEQGPARHNETPREARGSLASASAFSSSSLSSTLKHRSKSLDSVSRRGCPAGPRHDRPRGRRYTWTYQQGSREGKEEKEVVGGERSPGNDGDGGRLRTVAFPRLLLRFSWCCLPLAASATEIIL